MLGPQATQVERMRLRAELGLDDPLYLQYGRWMGHVVQGDLGRSLWMRRPVLGEVLVRFRATLLLTATALVISSIGGVALGILSATRPNSLLDRTERRGLALRREHARLLARHRAHGDLLALARLAAGLRDVRAVRRRRRARSPGATSCCPR